MYSSHSLCESSPTRLLFGLLSTVTGVAMNHDTSLRYQPWAP
ncbi:hypothetical protein GBAR_LOCUS22661 [Geodia barretti]|uniref:Uncharacterized protein n=1 Tax=Geodia barretti TaxID=519541 RepID=A0AA35X7Q8_GEOBA|nr:hypothetical protein GBAR_LOCUS22661 [Geodia barretti]